MDKYFWLSVIVFWVSLVGYNVGGWNGWLTICIIINILWIIRGIYKLLKNG